MRTINIIGEINDKTIKDVLEKIFEIEKEDNKILKANSKMLLKTDHKELEDLTINITSVGGLVYGFNAIYDALSKLKCKVITRGFGLCASAGFWLMLAGDERYAGKNTRFLYHTLGYDNGYDMLQFHKERLETSEKLQKNLEKIIIEKTNITQDMLDEHIKDDWNIFFDEAVKLNVIQGEI
ncbi:ClpP family protease [Peptacetobacter sp. AB800]|uniref:ClpP family protease n=1 Tax=Peptacetobacter sp. AB800 TaxID=3388428 RepID=UPI0039FC4E0D